MNVEPRPGAGNYPDPLAAPPVVTAASCVIRFDVDGIYVHNNESHAAIGIRQVWVDTSGQLVVDHARVGLAVSIVAAVDETLAERGVTAGGSGGGAQTRIRFGHPKITGRLRLDWPTHYALIAGEGTNLWLEVRQTLEPAGPAPEACA